MHIFNGAFGEKGFEYCKKIRSNTESIFHDLEENIPLDKINPEGFDTIFLTHNETSNGTTIPLEDLKEIRTKANTQIIAVDATSSMAGYHIDFSVADIWYASVQKCFGLPSGMAIMVLSPQAVQRARQLNNQKHYNSLPFILDNFDKYQTHYTPNILNIYVLMRLMEDRLHITDIFEVLEKRYQELSCLIDQHPNFNFLVKNQSLRSKTVLCIKHNDLGKLKNASLSNNITLGNGYGKWKNHTFRIANFPAISEDDILRLTHFLNEQ